MSSSSASNAKTAVFPMLVMLSIVIGGYAAYLVDKGEELNYQAAALAPVWYMFKPRFLTQFISDGGYVGTLVAVGLNIAHALLYVALAYTAVTIGFARFFKPRNGQAEDVAVEVVDPAVSGIYPCEIPGSSMMIMIPDSRDPSTGATIEGVKDKDPFEQFFVRCDRKPVATARPPITPVEKLQVAVLELLAAHPSVPASVGHHHADATLADHSKAISRAIAEYMHHKGWEEPLARVAGLAHDVDKLLAYQEKEPGQWVKRKDATHHNTFSAYLIRQQPEFKALPEEDQFTLTMALRYYHHPGSLPTNAGERVERLISAIRHADGKTIQSEKAAGIANAQAASNTIALVALAIEKFLTAADINGYRGGQAAGWTKDAYEYVIIPMSGVIESIGEFLPNELLRQLQLGVDSRNFKHPSVPVIRDALNSLGLLMSKVKDLESPTGMFDVKVGVKVWRACVLLDKDRISELLPTTVPKWGTTMYGMVKIQKPTLDKSHAEDEEPAASASG
ncbi:HD domain-containing protein [Pseudomonas sp. P66]|uniref:HD domain-containing protein n=2 Tax=Pseudomonas arcuscaelestis TaxID=2710591 RepID=A0ABS2C0W2_9PSED|nr:HD domain-containing protein [Pseudomonas arcuscaelestis]